MNPFVFLNELSEHPLAPDANTANERMNTFIDMLSLLKRRTERLPPLQLRTRISATDIEISPSYFVINWVRQTDQVRRAFFLKMASSSPFFNAADDQADVLARFGCIECSVFGEVSHGLRAAWAADEFAASLDSDARWQTPVLDVEISKLSDDGEIEVQPEKVRHLSISEHVAEYAEWIEDRIRTSVRDGRDLWERRSTLFPNLDWCNQTEKQIISFGAGSPQLRQIVLRLLELDTAFSTWDKNPISPEFVASKCSPETPMTLRQEAADHTATLPNGTQHLFSWHVRFTPGGGRIFFDGDITSGRGQVGYVGIKKNDRLT